MRLHLILLLSCMPDFSLCEVAEEVDCDSYFSSPEVCDVDGNWFKTACHAREAGIKPVDLLCRLTGHGSSDAAEGQKRCEEKCKRNGEVQRCYKDERVDPQCSTQNRDEIYRNTCGAAGDNTRPCGGAKVCNKNERGRCCDLENGKCRNW